jgi:hypothetical protein
METEKKEQPKSGAPKTDPMKDGSLAKLLAATKPGKGEKMPQQKGKDVTTPPPETNAVKPHSPDLDKLTEKFGTF